VLGEAADERDRGLVGGARVAAGARQRHAVLGDRAALPDDAQIGLVVLAVDGDDDLGDDRAQQLLALAVAGGGRLEDLAQVGAGAPAPGDLLVGERRRAPRAGRRERLLGAADLGQALLPLALQRARDEPVLGFAGVELATRAVGADTRPLEFELGRAHARVMVVGRLLDRAERRLDRGRPERFEQRVEHDLLDPAPADALAAVAAVELRRGCTRSAARGSGRCSRPASSARSVRSGSGPAAALGPHARRRRPSPRGGRQLARRRSWLAR
jgi:hypothetical protein